LRVEPAKQIAGEKRGFDFLDPVRPTSPALVKRQEPFIALAVEKCGDRIFIARPNP
jgi:hypothetical protein